MLFSFIAASRHIGFIYVGFLLLGGFFLSATTLSAPIPFDEYWYKGQGEVNTYSLKQIRYGEIHEGEALLIFEAEDFSNSKQVKLDYPEAAGGDAIKILKTNQIRKFATGVYDYSVMQSVFTPIDSEKNPNTLKVSTSVQDWNGHVFTQLNMQAHQYAFKVFSYFESEGNTEVFLSKVLLEDEIFNIIRINPAELPTGNIQIIPSMVALRFLHQTPEVLDARAKIEVGKKTNIYELDYIKSGHKLKIMFKNEFPYTIEGWEEHYKEDGKKLLTTATLKKSMLMAYTNRHFNSDKNLRDELMLKK